MSSSEDRVKAQLEVSLDELQSLYYDAGWNAVLDELNNAITEKQWVNDQRAVEVLTEFRSRVADLAESVEDE